MEEQLSLIDLVINASITVQLVMAILMLASMLSWYMIVQRFIYLRNAREEMYSFEERFWSGIDLSQLYREGNESSADGHVILGMESIFRAGFKEFSRLAQQSEMDSEAILLWAVEIVGPAVLMVLCNRDKRLVQRIGAVDEGDV